MVSPRHIAGSSAAGFVDRKPPVTETIILSLAEQPLSSVTVSVKVVSDSGDRKTGLSSVASSSISAGSQLKESGSAPDAAASLI